MKVYNNTKTGLMICSGVYANPESWIVGTIEEGELAELPLEDGDFVNIQSVEDD